jgi:pimeloyl-ACP methyl ester carboxylesterase
LLVGYSEGAYLAPEVALSDDRVEAVVMIGGGTRGWLKEEISNAKKSDLSYVRKQIREIESSPNSLKKWNGFSYATWYSYREDRTLESLRRLHTPALAILGRRDRTIDFKSTVQDLKRLRRQRHWIEIEVIRQCGHSFKGHWGSVRRTLKKYISSLASN